MPHHHHHHEEEVTEHAKRWPLLLAEHPIVELVSDFAHLTVVSTNDEPYLEAFGEKGAPQIEIQPKGGTTHIRVGSPWHGDKWWNEPFWEAAFWEKRRWKRGLHARVVLHVPPAVTARIRASAAKIRVEDLEGCDLAVQADAGALTLRNVGGKIRLSTDAGRIDGQNLRGTFDVATSAGAVHLEIASLDAGTHRVRTSMGAAHIALARGLPVRIDTRTTMGASRVDFPQTRDAASILEIEADLGAIRVTPSDREWQGTPAPAPAPATSPYRSPAAPSTSDTDVQKVLERVADGSLTPAAARELLRAMGWV